MGSSNKAADDELQGERGVADAGELESATLNATPNNLTGDTDTSHEPPPVPPRPPRLLQKGGPQKQPSTRFDYSIFHDSRKNPTPTRGKKESGQRVPPSVPSSHESETGWGSSHQ